MRRSAMLSNAAALSMLVLLAAYPSRADTANEQKPTCADDAMLVFDASGSMAATDFPEGAPSRMDRVRQALVKVLPAASQTRRLGLHGLWPRSEFQHVQQRRLASAANIERGQAHHARSRAIAPGGSDTLDVLSEAGR